MKHIGGKKMYFPYVRGRQYELLALRELIENDILSSKIIPIIEPVKLSPTLLKTMETFVKKDKELIIICNPAVGTFGSDMNKADVAKDKNKAMFLSLLGNGKILKGHIMKKNSKSFIDIWKYKMNTEKDDWIVINNNREYQEQYSEIFYDITPRFVFIPDESSFRRQVRRNRILLVDRFNKRDRNSAYSDNEDEFYSDDHRFYEDDGFKGFADFSIIGNDYLESGFAPYAVAIHIVYFKDENLRVHHFVSDTNDDIQNPAKKFYEATEKLYNWVLSNNIQHTRGLDGFIEHYNNQTYPGLGSVKKLSLMHHLELIGKYLDEVH